MKKTKKAFCVILVLIMLLTSTNLATLHVAYADIGSSIKITFADQNLKQALIKDGVDADHDGQITNIELGAMTNLDLSNDKIKDLTGLEYAVNLTNLNLGSNAIEEISPLKNLTNLTYLSLNNNNISDISKSLPALSSLTSLDISNNAITDIDSLSSLTKLTSLYVENNSLTDVNVLSNFPQLQNVNIQNNYLNISSGSGDMQILNSLPSACIKNYDPQKGLVVDPNTVINFPDANLKQRLLSIHGIDANYDRQITRGELAGFNGILSLSKSDISNLTGLEYAVNAKGLDLSDNKVTDLTPIAGLTQLSSLNLDGNHITDFTPIKNLKKFYHSISRSNKTDISTDSVQTPIFNTVKQSSSNLKTFTNTTKQATVPQPDTIINFPDDDLKFALLDVSGIDANNDGQITRGELANYSGDLSVSNWNITNLTGLEYAVNASGLDLSINNITDLTPIAGLTQLVSLYLYGNNITDLTPIKNFKNLKTLDVSMNNIDISIGSAQMPIISSLTLNNPNINFTYSPQKKTVPLPDTVIVFPDDNLKQALLNNYEIDLNSDGQITRGELANYSGNLWLNYDNIKNLTGLEYAVNISGLSLGSNNITDLTPIQGLTNLSSLDVSMNNIDISAGSAQMSIIKTLTQNNPGLQSNLTYSPQKKTVPQPDTVIDFPDHNLLQSLLYEGIDANNDGQITRGELANYSGSLWLSYDNITNLTGLEYAVNIDSLSLEQNNISDLSPISGLTQLKEIYLSDNNITDLSPIKDFTNLDSLDVTYNNIDISDGSAQMTIINTLQQNNTNLNTIYYSPQKRPVSQPNTVINFPDQSLKLALMDNGVDSNHDGNITRGELANDIGYLNLSNYGITDLTGLDYAVNAYTIDLSYNNISNIYALSNLTQLSELDLNNNHISSLISFDDFTNLSMLNLSDNAITDITDLLNINNASGETVAYIQRNYLSSDMINAFCAKFYSPSGNEQDLFYPQNNYPLNSVDSTVNISDIKLLKALIKSGYDTNRDGLISKKELAAAVDLDLSGSGITNITGLQFAVNAINIDLSNNSITDFSLLEQIPSICSLNLAGNGISNISAIKNLNFNYEGTLNLSNNPIGDVNIKTVYSIKNLEQLFIAKTGITNITGVSTLPSLWKLDVSGNNITNISELGYCSNSLSFVDVSQNPLNFSVGTPAQIVQSKLLAKGISFSDSDSYVNIPDKNFFKALVRDGYDVNNDGLISENEIQINGSNLPDLSDCGIKDLTGIECFAPYSNVNLSGNFIKDISLLKDFTGGYFDLSNNLISDMSPFEGKSDLSYLDLSNNKLTNITALENIHFNYEGYLNLSGNSIADISPLYGNTDIQTLYLANNKITDITGISSLQNVNILDISNNQINDISDLQNCSSILTDVYAYNITANQPSVVNALTNNGIKIGIGNMNTINIPDKNLLNALIKNDVDTNGDGKIQDYEMQNQTYLDLSSDGIYNLTGLEYATNLQELDVSNNFIEDITPLQNLHFYSLNLENNYIDFTAGSQNYIVFSNLAKTAWTQCSGQKPGSHFVQSTSITMSNKMSIPVNTMGQLSITVLPITATDTNAIWSSSDETIAKVDQNGNVYGLKKGTAVITATTQNGNKATCTVTVVDFIIGDVNGDGKITSADALMILKAAAGKTTLSANQIQAADVNGSGTITSLDALEILKFSAGKITSF